MLLDPTRCVVLCLHQKRKTFIVLDVLPSCLCAVVDFPKDIIRSEFHFNQEFFS